MQSARIRDRHTLISVAFGTACNAALTVAVLWHQQDDQSPLERLGWLWASLAAGGAAALLVAYGAMFNDLLDRRRDAVMSGARALAPIGPRVIVLVGSLLLALFAASALGPESVYTAMAVAALLLFHNGVARFIPAIGLVVPSAVVAGIMLVPDWQMPMPIAIWLALTLVLGVSIGVHILGEKRPLLSARAIPVVVAGWGVLSAVVLSLRILAGASAPSIEGLHWWPLIAALLGLAGLLRWWIPSAPSRTVRAGRLVRIVALWQPVLAAAWCLALGATAAGIGVLVVALGGWLVIGGARTMASRVGNDVGWRA